MARLGEIASVIRSDKHNDKSIVSAIFDTSSLIARDQMQWWIPPSLKTVVGEPGNLYKPIILQVVIDELNRIYKLKTKDELGIRKLTVPAEQILQDITPKKEMEIFTATSELISIVQDNYIETSRKSLQGKKLSKTDLYIVDYAYGYAKEGIITVVLTADSHIFDVLNDMKKIEPQLPIICVSPFEVKKYWLGNIDEALLVTNELLAKIMKLDPKTSIHYYVHVSRQQKWREGFVNDIAHDLWKPSINSRHPKQSEFEVYCPLLLGRDEKTIDKKFDGIGDYKYIITAIPENPPIVGYYNKSNMYIDDITKIPKLYFTPYPWLRIDTNFLHPKPDLEKRIRS